MAKSKKTTSPRSQPAITTKPLTHREFMLLRNDRLGLMFNAIEASPKVKQAFFKNPGVIASRFDVVLTPDEIHAIKLFGGTPRELEKLLGHGGVAVFDSNCKCSAVLDIAGELINPPPFM